MKQSSSNIASVAFSIRVYQLLLSMYPSRFRKEYGTHMTQAFRDCCLRAAKHNNSGGMMKLWLVTLIDFVQSVVSEHLQKEIEMKKEMKPEDIRLAGWALMVGSVVFSLGIFVGFTQFDNWYVMIALVALISMPLLAFGLLGLRRRYGDQVGGFGKNILLIGAIIGPLASIIGYFGEVGPIDGGNESIWVLIFAGPIVLFACLALFGVIALFRKPLPRWNGLPLVAGVGFPFLYLLAVITGSPNLFGLLIVVLTIQSVAWVMLGYLLKSDVPEESVSVA